MRSTVEMMWTSLVSESHEPVFRFGYGAESTIPMTSGLVCRFNINLSQFQSAELREIGRLTAIGLERWKAMTNIKPDMHWAFQAGNAGLLDPKQKHVKFVPPVFRT